MPSGEIQASVGLVHGIHEHSGRYAYLASRLMLQGIEVHALDLRGHGESEGARGQIDSFSEYAEDVERWMEHVQATRSDVPLFVMGHSMGGLVVSDWYSSGEREALDGLILSSAALRVPPPNPLLLAVAPLVSRYAPRLPVGKVDVSRLSRDPAVGDRYLNDPLNTTSGVQARTGNELLQASERVSARTAAFGLPMYLFHGSEDEITDPDGTRHLASNAPSDDVTLRIWEGLRHETFHEPERDEVIDSIAEWVLAHT